MTLKKLAVLIPTCRPGGYLRRCLESLDNQCLERFRFHVYIALNGERAPYESFITELLKGVKFNHTLIFTEIEGVSNARNLLLSSSFEDFLTFIDDDDWVSEGFLESLLDLATDKAISVSNSLDFCEGSTTLSQNFLSFAYTKIADMEESRFKFRSYLSPPWGKVFHRRMIGDQLFDVALAKGEDSLFFAQISNRIHSAIKSPPEACYFVNRRFGSVTRSSINFSKDLPQLIYCFKCYSLLLTRKEYDPLFILSRIVATLMKMFYLVMAIVPSRRRSV
jgi:glycosyltransferase involved in cell wall biosynthesis